MVIDIMVPYYGPLNWLKETIDSVVAQDSGQWRLVVVDDRYPDSKAAELVASYDDDRIEYVLNPEQLGLAGNFKRCLELSRSQYLVIPGGDDRFLPNYVSTMLAAVADDPDIVQPGVAVIDEVGAPINAMADRIKLAIRPRLSMPYTVSGEKAGVTLMRGNWLYWPSLLLHRQSVLPWAFRDFPIMLDLALSVDVLLAGGKIKVIPEVCFEYRRSRLSVSGAGARDGKLFADERAYFGLAASLFAKRGWKSAERAAKLHITSRAHALSKIPGAVLGRDFGYAKVLARHLAGVKLPTPQEDDQGKEGGAERDDSNRGRTV